MKKLGYPKSGCSKFFQKKVLLWLPMQVCLILWAQELVGLRSIRGGFAYQQTAWKQKSGERGGGQWNVCNVCDCKGAERPKRRRLGKQQIRCNKREQLTHMLMGLHSMFITADFTDHFPHTLLSEGT